MSQDRPPPDLPAAPTAASGPPDPWAALRRTTPARIGLGRIGDTLPLRPVLDLQLAHAAARDAVHAGLDVEALAAAMAPLSPAARPIIHVRSAAPDRATYLKRPDLGRTLDQVDQAALGRIAEAPCDCVLILADGLSAAAATAHGVSVIERCLTRLAALTIGPLVIATQARVALGDPVAATLRARLCVVLIGERPGLSVADSLGAYITFDPRVGRRDSERNCVSNIHPKGGLSADEAARKIAWLVGAALERGHSGVALKEAEASVTLIATDP